MNHSLREGNQSANFLAKYGARKNQHVIILEMPLPRMEVMLLADLMGVEFPREET